MFSKKTAFLVGIVIFIATSFTILTVSSRNALSENSVEQIAISIISPFQMLASASFNWCADIWSVYFSNVSAVEENMQLKRELALAMADQTQCKEIELENGRMRRLLDLNNGADDAFIAAKVIGRDPSPWFKTLMINKGASVGVVKGLPVLVSEGIVGQIIEVSERFSRVLLITDRNSAVDALVQSSRARGIVQGNNTDECLFKYSLRKDDVSKGDVIISSGLDQVFPKGLRIGEVFEIKKDNSDLFQVISIKTFVDFDKLEEVLVVSTPVNFLSNNNFYAIENDKDRTSERAEDDSSISELKNEKKDKVTKISYKQDSITLQQNHNLPRTIKKSTKNASSGQKNSLKKEEESEEPLKRENQ